MCVKEQKAFTLTARGSQQYADIMKSSLDQETKGILLSSTFHITLCAVFSLKEQPAE